MGLENREYYRDEPSFGNFNQFGNSYGSSGRWTMVITIIVINCVIFVADMFSDLFVAKPDDTKGMLALMRFLAMDSAAPWRIWSILTHGFAHSSLGSDTGILHILFNMFALFILGRPIEERLGRWEFLKFYLVAIVCSGLVFLISRTIGGNRGIVVGASGAVSAVVMLFVVCYPNQKLFLMGVIPMPAWLLGVLFILLDLTRAFDPNSNIAWEAHLGGAAFGAAYFYFQWNFNWLKLEKISELFSNKPRLRVHDPNRGFEKLQKDADRVLAKINEQGEQSLTRSERKILNRYSKQLRKNG